MNYIKHYSIKEKLRLLITCIFCIAFSTYTINIIINADNIASKLLFACIMLVCVGMVIFSEHLKAMYYHAIEELNFRFNPEHAKQLMDHLQKQDFLGSYKKTRLVFDVLYFNEQSDFQTCINILDDNEKFFRSSLDNLLVMKFTYLYSYYKLKEKSKVKKYYQEIQELRGAKIKGTKLSPLFNWEYIDAIYYRAIKDNKKSKTAFANINAKNMNNREKYQYLCEYADLMQEMKIDNKEKQLRLEAENLKRSIINESE